MVVKSKPKAVVKKPVAAPKKPNAIQKIASAVVSIASPTKKVGLAKTAVKTGIGIASSLLGGSSRAAPKKKRGYSLAKATKRLIKAKIEGKIMREKLKVVNSIK